MKVIIVEDEIANSENLIFLLNNIDPNIEVLKVLDSVSESVSYFSKLTDAELVFMDIHLADGISFEIFKQVNITVPVVFTTAYDQYALQAFKVNSVDYLLKPIDEGELSTAIDKFKTLQNNSSIAPNIEDLIQTLYQKNKSFKSTYLVQKRDELIPLKTESIAYFFIDAGVVKATTFQNQKFVIDKKLEDIESELDPVAFYRANRQIIINKEAIANLKVYFGGKLIVNSEPPYEERIVISKAKASEFKKWVNS